jgi:hypothetical protein
MPAPPTHRHPLVGTDVLIALDEHALGRASKAVARRAVHWVDAPWLADELATMGITAEHVQLPVEGLSQDAPPLPPRFTVLLYLPVDSFDREVFDMETLLRRPRASRRASSSSRRPPRRAAAPAQRRNPRLGGRHGRAWRR